MLGNGYKERLANAQSSIGSLLSNLPMQASGLSSGLEQQQAPLTEDNEPAMDSTPFKLSFATKPTAVSSTNSGAIGVNAPPLPLVHVPVMESNSASRYSSLYQPQPNHRRRGSHFANEAFNSGRNAEQFHELGLLLPESNSGGNTKRSLARSSVDGFTIPTSFLQDGSSGNGNRRLSDLAVTEYQQAMPGQPGSSSDSDSTGPVVLEASASHLDAVVTIQRAIRRFLARKPTRRNKISSDNTNVKKRQVASEPIVPCVKSEAAKEKVDMKMLQQTCLRQSAEIDQLKELMTKLLRESEEDRRKLRQRDKEIEDLMKTQQRLTQSASLASGLDKSSASIHSVVSASARLTGKYDGFGNEHNSSSFNLASSATVPSLDTLSLSDDNTPADMLDLDDVYDTSSSYINSFGGGPAIHPLSTLPSRSNSIISLQPQAIQSLSGLKINQASSMSMLYQQQHQGLDSLDSPSSDYPSQDVTSNFNANNGRGLTGAHHYHQHSQHQHHQQHGSGYQPQVSFHTLAHRNSIGSFSSSSGRGYDSPAIEQPTPYPWSVSTSSVTTTTGGVSHSQSWSDDVTTGYGYDSSVSSPGQYQHGSMAQSGGFDPNFIHQYPHGSQQQQPQQQSHPSSRHSYRRHSDKPVHLDYQARTSCHVFGLSDALVRMCIDRILQATDQQASIHLQQKLKTSPPDQKVQIIDSILGGGGGSQTYPLMCNRFGNFLIQRCFEFGTPQQIERLAYAMRGNILTLACDPFGCHVVQKALDTVEEDYKARIVTEMFRRIPETIVHRYACHVWQKVFEIRWTDSPPAVMTYVNNAVAGKWPSVAVDETGSLVVQNIFENCPEHDKRPVLNEILQSVTTIAKGQWGNWVIQHILEHGAPADRATVTQKILEDAVSLSLDQYASKVVEKTLRTAAQHSSIITASSLVAATAGGSSISNPPDKNKDNAENPGPPTVTVNGTTIHLTQEEVMAQYISIVCDGVLDRPRIPLIDIAADQYGNYIVQYILTNAGPQHRETCAALIKRHMVSLRGSKYGQKVAFMVERWRGGPFSNNNNSSNSNNNGSASSGISGNSHGSNSGNSHNNNGGHGSYGSKSGSLDGGSSGGSGGGRRRW
ncbi:hypothetical protein BGX31_007156 [Mortierella sp. GBA43]|nr:hypothetical protein BGX31_007156 [Mortierella sp. GBA43]